MLYLVATEVNTTEAIYLTIYMFMMTSLHSNTPTLHTLFVYLIYNSL